MKKLLVFTLILSLMATAMIGGVSAETAGDYPEYLNMDGSRRIIKDGYDVTLDVMVCRTLGATTDINDQFFVQFIEKELGIGLNVEEVSYEVGGQKRQLQLASGDLPDINHYLSLNNNLQVQYGMEEEILLPYSDYFSEELTPNIMRTLDEYPEIRNNYTLPNGKMYTLPWNISAGLPGSGDQFLFINCDYLDAIGMAKEDVPTDLDSFLDMLRAFKALDPATLGVDEIIPFVGCDDVEQIPINAAMGWACGYNQFLNPVWDCQVRDVVIPALTEKYKDWVNVFRIMYTEGLMDKDYYTVDDDTTRAKISQGKAAVYCDYGAQSYVDTNFETWFCRNLDSEFNGGHGLVVKGNLCSGNHVFSDADTEYPEVIVRLFDYMLSPEGSVYCSYGAPEGSEDTLGIIDGYTINPETGFISAPSMNDHIWLAQCEIRNQRYLYSYAYELLGATAPIDPVYGTLIQGDGSLQYERYDAILKNDLYVQSAPGVFMDADTATRVADLKTLLDEHRASETAKFVTGVRDWGEWDAYVAEMDARGAQEYKEIYDEAYDWYVRPDDER